MTVREGGKATKMTAGWHLDDDGWNDVETFFSADGRRVIVVQGQDDLFRYESLRWQRYYDPSPEDETAPVEGGIWVEDGRTVAVGLYASVEAAKADAHATVDWFAKL